jgi:hypothetical protein
MWKDLPRIALTLASVVFVGSWGLLASSPATASAPKAVIAATLHDFGQVSEEQHLSHTFIIRNGGDAPLEILRVDPDCACSVVDYDRRILPGGEGKLTLGIKPFSVVRPFEKKTQVRFNDPEQSQVTFVLKGVARPIIEIQPHHIVRWRGSFNAELKAEVRFISHQSEPWEITRFETNLTDKIAVAIRPEVTGKIYVVEVKNISKQAGHYAGKIDLFTTSKRRPRLIMRVFAELYPDSLGSP